MLAHLVFRNTDGSLTLTGWYWLVISGWVLVWAAAYFAAPKLLFGILGWQVRRSRRPNSFISAARVEEWKGSRRARLVVRAASLALACMAIWFASMAVAAGPGQLV
ncbi:MAG: hypothetical protein DLM65_01930 [Candidatus Aeolococcus gillhamiae]|uniref:Uncharacterized protein n=1 Tax=Candidatus Aeolococcus gillhamiae TaxID=3127015 RepID=A0A2W6AZG3_9BACT|nr:MAG: hypothetical protein DLM65_01930 [Candidatus Dormibacter sp. RRmetagenome_bin12]